MKKIIISSLLFLISLQNKVLGDSYQVFEDLINDGNKILFSIKADNKFNDIYDRKSEAVLKIRCNTKETNITLFTQTFNSDNNQIYLRWDKSEPVTADWKVSLSSDSYTVLDTKNFIQDIYDNNFLAVQWKPLKYPPLVAKFDLNSQDFKENIKKAKIDGCKI